MDKLLVICGPTAVGKTDLGVKLAKKFNGEIISADSRQAYKGMDIITGKDLPKNSKLETQNSKLNIDNNKLEVGYRLKDDIPVWLTDIAEPDYIFSSGEFAVLAQKVINDIRSRGKLPIIVGGTGFYIRSIINPYETYTIPPDKILRQKLEKLSLDALQYKLEKEDKLRWEGMNDSDRKNPRRLIRAIEVAERKKNFSQKFSGLSVMKPKNILMIGLKLDFKVLRQKIYKRIRERLDKGALDEVKKLMEKKFSWFLPSLSATGALEIKKYINGQQPLDETIRSWQYREIDYAKKQLTYFKKSLRQAGGIWFDVAEKNYLPQIENLVEKWYTEKQPS